MRSICLLWGALGAVCLTSCGSAPAPADDAEADFVVVLLKAGSRRQLPPGELQSLMTAHFDAQARMVASGDILVTGEISPPRADPDSRGLLIFDTADVAHAEELARSDPAVVADVLRVEAFPWRGPAGLRQVPSMERAMRAQLSPDAPLDVTIRPYVMGVSADAEATAAALAPLRENGKLVFFGRLGGDRDGAALFALDSRDVETAAALLAAIVPPVPECELHPWFGPRALQDI